MNEIFYVAKRIREPDTLDGDGKVIKQGDIIGYKVLYATDKKIAPRGEFDVLIGDDDFKFKKAELIGTEWRVVEDVAARDAAAADQSDRDAKRQAVRDKLGTVGGDNSIAKLRDTVQTILEYLDLD